MTLPGARPVRVMIVDDSAVIRSIIDKILKADTAIEVCGFAMNGQQAVQSMASCDPDVVVLDIEMPVMDGLTAIPLLLAEKKSVRIIVCSTLSERGADVSLKALSLGATDYILKPSGANAIQGSGDFHTSLLRMVRQLGAQPPAAAPRPAAAQPAAAQPAVVQLRPAPVHLPAVVAIGTSTGGPNALAAVLAGLSGLPVPIVITQHMPKTFTKILAAHLEKSAGSPCCEGEEGMILRAGQAYVAPGGYHMLFRAAPEGVALHLDDGPMENFCKPAVDPMLRSLCQAYGGRVLAAILTGMGEDGLAGARAVTRAGGTVVAQDSASSVVWGMPGAVVGAGLSSAVLGLPDIAGYIRKACGATQAPTAAKREEAGII